MVVQIQLSICHVQSIGMLMLIMRFRLKWRTVSNKFNDLEYNTMLRDT